MLRVIMLNGAYTPLTLSVIMLNGTYKPLTLSVIMLIVVMQRVVEPD
jgi:hypothetical protein